MKPWWLRPFAPGASEDDPTASENEPADDAADEPSPDERGGPAAETAGEGGARRGRPRRPEPTSAASAQAHGPQADAPAETGEGDDDEAPAANGDEPRRTRTRRGRGSRGRGRNGKPRPEAAADDEASEKASASEPPPSEGQPSERRPSERQPTERRFADRRPERAARGAARRQAMADDDEAPRRDNSRDDLPVSSERNTSVNDERKLALFCDLENIALGVRDSNEVKKFDINLVLERLLEKGKIIVKKAYCDWERYSEFKRPFHEAAIELIDIPQKYYSGKNSADIKMVVDAMDLCYSKEHLDTFVVLSGDSDFSPLVSKLKENNKYVIGIGVKGASSNLLIANCDEFIYYEDVWRDQQKAPKLDGLPKKASEVFGLMTDAIQALVRENKDVLWGSMIKQTMQRKKPSFNEGYYGYSTFSELLEDAEEKKVIRLKKDQRSGSYIVTGFSDR